MKRKILALAIAGALACPQVAFAARDGDGMEYVSAAEGFYGSLRTMYSSNSGEKDNNGKITGDGSRLGVRGTLDLGHGLTGLYRYEWRVKDLNSGNAANGTRLHYVGLKGTFGEAQFGTLWENDYNWVTAATDIATTGSGNFAPHFRRNNSLQYTSPNLNGFQGSFRVMMDGGSDRLIPARRAGCYANAADTTRADPTNQSAIDGQTAADASVITPTCPTGDSYQQARDEVTVSENVDEYALVAKYGVRGFTVAGVYETQPDGLTKADDSKDNATFWAVRGGYAQDNWAVNAWYGVDNNSDKGGDNDDGKTFSVAGNIDIGKVALVVIHENKESGMKAARKDDSATIFNVNYNFTSKSRVYGAYIANDYDSDTAKDDEVRIGLRMDF